MRFHVVGLPHTQTTRAFSVCAYSEKVRKFCVMMHGLGHTVYLYAGEQNEAPCTELIPCISEVERSLVVGSGHYVHASFDNSLPHWRRFNNAAIAGIKERAQPGDFICVIAGIAHKPIADALPDMTTVEFGIGYSGTFAKFRVWESYAWMHTVYGAQAHDAHAVDGMWYDAVIPNYFEIDQFPFQEKKGDHYLFIGRLIERKGFRIAADVCKEIGAPLVIAGLGTPPDYGTHVGTVGPVQRGAIMSRAKAVFVPTIYAEPFGGVAVEAMLCGTPIITTDWGAFTETNIHGVTGFRCRTHKEFVQAAHDVTSLHPRTIRDYAIANYSLEAVGRKYQTYFDRLASMRDGGWYAK